jgi:hypothetical protein
MRWRGALLQRLVSFGEHVLRGFGLRLRALLPGQHVRRLLQVERRLLGQPVLQHGDRAVLNGLSVHDRLGVPDGPMLQHRKWELLCVLQDERRLQGGERVLLAVTWGVRRVVR